MLTMTSQIGKAGNFQDESLVGLPASPQHCLEVKIFKQWLKNRKDIKADQYRSIVKQTMLLAAARMEARIQENEELLPNMTDMNI